MTGAKTNELGADRREYCPWCNDRHVLVDNPNRNSPVKKICPKCAIKAAAHYTPKATAPVSAPSADPQWHQAHEATKGDFLERCRNIAREHLKYNATVTVDDIRDIVEIPDGMDRRVMGSVFRHSDFEGTGDYVKSKRSDCHHRPIQKFRIKPAEAA